MHFISQSLSIAALALCFGISPGWADKDGHGHGKGKSHKEKSHGKSHGKDKHWEKRDNDHRPHHDRVHYMDRRHGGHRTDIVVINPSDRIIINRYIANDFRSHCPPGLAKKRNGCRPPGHTKHYHIGRPLPEYVHWHPVPRDLLVRLEPVPAGYQYVMVDRDVLLISEASKKVIDAITLLSAVGSY